MKNLDITVVGPQGSGKSQLAKNILNVLGLTPERVAVIADDAILLDAASVSEVLRQNAADAVIFDGGFTEGGTRLAIAAEAVELYREHTRRNVAAIYCVQSKFTNLLNPSNND